jgi:putative membrane-bound dehydrogenase-like protein
MRRGALAAICLALLAATPQDRSRPPQVRSPLDPEQALSAFQIAAGYRVELVAAEPVVVDPVQIAWDEHGRMWVVEYRDYPNGPKPTEGTCRIKILEDRDADGRYEHVTVFADKLLFTQSLMPWKGGVIATAAPHVVFLEDTDGDGRADRRGVLFEGFAPGNPQLRVNHPTFALDNWIYVSNGLSGGEVRAASRPDDKPVSVRGMDFRFDLRSGRYEAIAGNGQFGLGFDDWGNRFICSNRNHVKHVVLPDRYVKRNPHLAAPDVATDIPEHGAAAAIFTINSNWTTSLQHAGTFTAACGVTIYRGELLPELRGNSLVCDPTGGIVHRDVLEPAGATFTARRAHADREFLASPDNWFRPVDLTTGPDGALYVVDMYRAVIEHPQYMPEELKQRPDLLLGTDRGRIWRIVPAGTPRHKQPPMPAAATPDGLVKMLAHPNAWWRYTAQRLLVERSQQAAVPALQRFAREAAAAVGRLHALYTLDGLGNLDAQQLRDSLRDPDAHVRLHAMRLSEPRLAADRSLSDAVLALASDRNEQVRFQLALTLGEIADPRATQILADLATQHGGDPWFRLAILSSVPETAGELAAQLLTPASEFARHPSTARTEFLRELAAVIGARQKIEEVDRLLRAVWRLPTDETRAVQMAAVNGLAAGLARRGRRLDRYLQALYPPGGPPAVPFGELFSAAAARSLDSKLDAAVRSESIQLLTHAPLGVVHDPLRKLVAADQPPAIRLAAVRALGAHPEPAVADSLFAGWADFPPALRREAVEAVLRQPGRIDRLLAEIASGRVKATDLDPQRVNQLTRHGDAAVRARAAKLLGAARPQDRLKAIEQYRSALALKPDLAHGRTLFQQKCATCHRVAGMGTEVGPNIADTYNKTPEALLVDMLDPNRAIDSNFVSYVVATKSGQVLTGLIVGETAASITLRRAENQTDTLLRQEIDEIQSTGQSLMPEGMERELSVQDVADVISFLKNWRYVEGGVPTGPPAK